MPPEGIALTRVPEFVKILGLPLNRRKQKA